MPRMQLFDIVKFCNNKRCEREIEYNQLATGGNDPTQSRALAYSHYVKYNRKKNVSKQKYDQIIENLFITIQQEVRLLGVENVIEEEVENVIEEEVENGIEEEVENVIEEEVGGSIQF